MAIDFDEIHNKPSHIVFSNYFKQLLNYFTFTPLQQTVRRIESTITDEWDRPIEEVMIAKSGVVEIDAPFSVKKEAATEQE